MVRKIFLVMLGLLMTSYAFAGNAIYVNDHAAISGYDPVAYVTDSAPVKGSKEFSYQWKGADWYFASAEHRDLFKANPEKYAPQYGGYCAYAAAKNALAPIDPAAWSIVGGKLYLNNSLSVRKKSPPGNSKQRNG